jgi:hypothetical protein
MNLPLGQDLFSLEGIIESNLGSLGFGFLLWC